MTVSGTAADVGGLVAGVDVSTDGGQTWNPASGTDRWSFVWVPTTRGQARLLVRATDDSANLQAPGSATVVTVS